MSTIAKEYIEGLKKAYIDNGGEEYWSEFENVKHGATQENIDKLKEAFPALPQELIGLLEYVDGTYWREYKGEEITVCFLGSDVEEYPYYILSSEEMIKNQNIAQEYYHDFIDREYDEAEIDDEIIANSKELKWLHFSDCVNNGGTSQLFIDFSPSPKGKVGQVVRFLHDPDSFEVIADSFGEYLKMIMEEGYDFVNEDYME